jgi:hypothetical protein
MRCRYIRGPSIYALLSAPMSDPIERPNVAGDGAPWRRTRRCVRRAVHGHGRAAEHAAAPRARPRPACSPPLFHLLVHRRLALAAAAIARNGKERGRRRVARPCRGGGGMRRVRCWRCQPRAVNPGRRLARGERRPSGQHGGGAMSDEGPRAEEGHDRRYAGVPAGARAGRRWNMSPRPSSSFPFTVLGLDWTLPTNHVGAGVIWFD